MSWGTRKARGLPVGYTPGFVDGATADMAFTMLMAIARNLVQGWVHARGPNYLVYDGNILNGHEIYGSTLGIIGMGRVGRVVARRASGFDMKVLYHNRNPSPHADELGASYRTLEELLEEADFVVLSVPMSPETRHLVSTAQLARMKETAFLINVARGGVVDHEALLDALQRNLIAGAAMDVTDPEPLPRDPSSLAARQLYHTPSPGQCHPPDSLPDVPTNGGQSACQPARGGDAQPHCLMRGTPSWGAARLPIAPIPCPLVGVEDRAAQPAAR